MPRTIFLNATRRVLVLLGFTGLICTMCPSKVAGQSCTAHIQLEKVTWLADVEIGFAQQPASGASVAGTTTLNYRFAFAGIGIVHSSVYGLDYTSNGWNASVGFQVPLRRLTVCGIYKFDRSVTDDLGPALTPPHEPLAAHIAHSSNIGTIAVGAAVGRVGRWEIYPTASVSVIVVTSRQDSALFVSEDRFAMLGMALGVGFIKDRRIGLTSTVSWSPHHPADLETGWTVSGAIGVRLRRFE